MDIKNPYIVKPICEMSPCQNVMRYAVVDRNSEESRTRMTTDPYANVIILCDLESSAEKIAEILNIEHYYREYYGK